MLLRTFAFALGLAACTPLTSAAPFTTATQPARDFFALNGTKMYHLPKEVETVGNQRIGWMKELGVRWDRSDLWWHTVEPTTGTWTWQWPDRVFAEFEKRDIQWYPILCYGTSWWKGHNAPRTDEEFRMWGEYVYRTMSRYRGRAPYWSVWNEPNIPNFWQPEPRPDDYAKMLKVTREAARRADPAARLCAPAIAPLQSWDRKFVERLYQLGCKDAFDVFDYHYYRHTAPEGEVPAEIAEIRAVMARYGDSKPIWISEAGVTSPLDKIAVTYPRQASLVVRNHLLALALGVEKFFYFDLQNWYDDPSHPWDACLGLVEAGGTRKPSFFAYKTLVREARGLDFIGRVTNLGRDLQGVLAHDVNTGRYMLAVWCTEENTTRTMMIACASAELRVTEPFGDERRVAARAGNSRREATVAVDMLPRYLDGVDPSVYLPEAGVQIAPAHLICAVGEKHAARVVTDPRMGGAKVRVVSGKFPEGVKWDSERGEITCTPSARPGKQDWSLTVEVEWKAGKEKRRTRLERSARIEVIPAVSAKFRPTGEGGAMRADATLQNALNSPATGDLTWTERRGGRDRVLATSSSITLAPGEIRVVGIPVPPSVHEAATSSFEWLLRFGPVEARPVRGIPVFVGGPEPNVDGKLDEWAGDTAMEINGRTQISRNVGLWSPRDASARVKVRLTPEHLCVAADVTDDDPMVNANPPVQMWKGDALEIYFGSGGPTGRTVIDKSREFQIGIAPVTKTTGPVVFLFHEDKVLSGAKVAARRTSRGYALEAAIALKDLGVSPARLAPGGFIGLDAALDDADRDDWAPAANDPGRALIWNGTGANWIDPSNWGLGVLVRPKER